MTTECEGITRKDINDLLNALQFLQDVKETVKLDLGSSRVFDYILQSELGKPIFSGSSAEGLGTISQHTQDKALNKSSSFDGGHGNYGLYFEPLDCDIMFESRVLVAHPWDQDYLKVHSCKEDEKMNLQMTYDNENKILVSLKFQCGPEGKTRWKRLTPISYLYSAVKCMRKKCRTKQCYCEGIPDFYDYGDFCRSCVQQNTVILKHELGRARVWMDDIKVSGPVILQSLYIENKLLINSTSSNKIEFYPRPQNSNTPFLCNTEGRWAADDLRWNYESRQSAKDFYLAGECPVWEENIKETKVEGNIENDRFLSTESSMVIRVECSPCIPCPHWPSVADDFRTRTRHTQYPSESAISSILSRGVHVVPKGLGSSKRSLTDHHKLRDLATLAAAGIYHKGYSKWRLSFSVAEKILIGEWNPCQRKCCLIAKILLMMTVYEFEGQHDYLLMDFTSDQPHKSLVTSYTIKTAMMWLCEELPQATWRLENLSECFDHLLTFLINSLKHRILKHYFVPSYNLFQNAEDEMVRRDIIIIESVRVRLLQYVYMYLIRETNWLQRGWPEAHKSLQRLVKPLSEVVYWVMIQKKSPDNSSLWLLQWELESHFYFMSTTPIKKLQTIFREYGTGANIDRPFPTDVNDFLKNITKTFQPDFLYEILLKPLLLELNSEIQSCQLPQRRILIKLLGTLLKIADEKIKGKVMKKIEQMISNEVENFLVFEQFELNENEKKELQQHPPITTWFADEFIASTHFEPDTISIHEQICFYTGFTTEELRHTYTDYEHQCYIPSKEYKFTDYKLTISTYYLYKADFLEAVNQFAVLPTDLSKDQEAEFFRDFVLIIVSFKQYQKAVAADILRRSQNNWERRHKSLEGMNGMMQASFRSFCRVRQFCDCFGDIDVRSLTYVELLKIEFWKIIFTKRPTINRVTYLAL